MPACSCSPGLLAIPEGLRRWTRFRYSSPPCWSSSLFVPPTSLRFSNPAGSSSELASRFSSRSAITVGVLFQLRNALSVDCLGCAATGPVQAAPGGRRIPMSRANERESSAWRGSCRRPRIGMTSLWRGARSTRTAIRMSAKMPSPGVLRGLGRPRDRRRTVFIALVCGTGCSRLSDSPHRLALRLRGEAWRAIRL
jgi:hypothetical protein